MASARTPRPRHVLHLRITLLGVSPPIERLIDIDGALPLAEVRLAVIAAFGLSTDTRHIFTDENLFLADLVDDRWREDDEWESYGGVWPESAHDAEYGRPFRVRPRRWGDKWTMIDWRDPEVISDSQSRLRAVFSDLSTLFLQIEELPGEWGGGPDRKLWFRIDAVGDEMTVPDAAAVRIVGGIGEVLLARGETVHEYATLMRKCNSPDDPEHFAARNELDRRIGPWATFDPARFDVDVAQDRLEEPAPQPWSRHPPTLLETLIDDLPASNAIGLRTHVAASGVALPPIVTRDDVASFTQPMRWLVTQLSAGPQELEDRELRPEFLAGWADAVGTDLSHVAVLSETAFRLSVMRRLRGQAVTKAAAREASADPMAMWRLLAEAVAHRQRRDHAGTLFTLALADGTTADPAAALARIEAAWEMLLDANRYSGPLYGPAWGRRRFGDGRSLIAGAERLYSAFGLTASPEGGWDVPPIVREFAHSVLLAEVRRW